MGNKIILFSDLHLGPDVVNKAHKVGVNTYGNLWNEISLLKEKILELNPLFVVNLGDVITSLDKVADINNYKSFLNIFSIKNIHHLLGNQDLKILNSLDLENLIGCNVRRSIVLNSVRHIFLDVYRFDRVVLGDNTLVWLKDNLNKDGEKVVIYSHYPVNLKKENISYYHEDYNFYNCTFIDKSKELLDLIKDSNCVAFISGHTHFYYECVIDGIKHFTIPSFSEDKDGKPSLEYVVFDVDNLKIEIKKI